MRGLGNLLGAVMPALALTVAPPAPAAAQCAKPVAAVAASPQRASSQPGAALDAAGVRACAVAAAGYDFSRATLVDARRGGGLRAAIPGSVVADVDVAAPPFGAAEPVVLIGEAADVRRLLGQCAQLRAAGYTNVHVLAGGVDAWRRAGRLPPRDHAPIAFVSSAELDRRASVAPQMLVFDANADTALRDLGDAAHAARRGESPAVAAARIARALERERVTPGIDPVVVVVAERGAAAAWRDAWNDTAYADPQFYVGTNEQFRSDVARGERIAQDRGKPLPGPCDR